MVFKLPSAKIFYPSGLSVIISKLCHSKIIIPIIIQVSRSYIRHPGDLFNNDSLIKFIVSCIFKDDNRAYFIIIGENHAKRSHHDIFIAVFIEIIYLSMCRSQNIYCQDRFRIYTGRVLPDPVDTVTSAVANNYIKQSVIVKVIRQYMINAVREMLTTLLLLSLRLLTSFDINLNMFN